MSFTIGSLFDGSGGFPLAGFLCGGVPVWASEIEPYPIAVTKSRFPHVKHLGSVTDIKGDEIEPVDVITFGSPCQDLSVAGKRAGLKHEDNGDDETTRSGLFMEAVRIIKEMREKTNGKYPRFAVWENVPGAFSSNKGEDFKVVLEEFIKIVEPTAVMPDVPKKGWAYADSYRGDGWSIAYRVFDAQYWGVPQRRRRIYLVADFRGERAREILFERDSLRGYSSQSRTSGETAPGNVESGIGATDCKDDSVIAIDKESYSSGSGFDRKPGIAVGGPVATLQANGAPHAVCYGISSFNSNSMLSDNPHSGIYEATTSRTLDLNGGNPSCNQGGIAIVEPIGFMRQLSGVEAHENVSPTLLAAMGESGNNKPCVAIPYTLKIRSGCEGGGKGALVQNDMSATLATNNDQYLFQPVAVMASSAVNAETTDGKISPCLMARAGTGGNQLPLIAIATQQGGAEISENGICPTITAAAGMSGNNQPWICKQYLFENHSQDTRYKGPLDVCPIVSATFGMGGNNQPFVVEETPVYCLQGNGIDRADTAGCNGKGWKEDTSYTLNTIDRPAVAYLASGKDAVGTLMASMATKQCLGDQEAFSGDYHIIEEQAQIYRQGGFGDYVEGEVGTVRASGGDSGGGSENLAVIYPQYIVRRLTPTECARLQGFIDDWGHPDKKDDFTDEEYAFWLNVRNTYAEINGKQTKDYTKAQMLTWYNKLHTDSAEYKMWGNGIALPNALYVMQGISNVYTSV